MYRIGQRYVPYFNRRNGRTGTLWEGRFKSCLVDSPRYVLGCYRYVEMNPVEAGIVRTPGSYAWSSYLGNAGLAENRLLTPHAEYVGLAPDLASSQAAYRGLFETGADNDLLKAIRAATLGGYPLVDDKLKARLATETTRTLQPGKPGPRHAESSERDAITGDLDL